MADQQPPHPHKSEHDKNVSIVIWSIIIIFAFAIALMVAIKYMPGRQQPAEERSYVYNGFRFENRNGTWFTQAQRGNIAYNLMFNFGPKEVENISMSGTPNMRLLSKDYVYLTFDPDAEKSNLPWMAVANSDMSIAFYKMFNVTTRPGCTTNHTDCEKNGARIIDCSSSEPVIMLKVSNTTSLSWEGKCLVINGEGREIDRAATRLIYKLLGIVP